MTIYLPFKHQLSIPSQDLSLTLISLNTWILIKITGPDTISYLHNQLTCDIKNMNKYQYNFSAYCNPNGKIISNMYVFLVNDQEINFLMPLNISDKQLVIMKKYATFSNVTITPDYNATVIGVTGKGSKKYLRSFFTTIPDQINTIILNKKVIILYFRFPIERYLLIITNTLLLNDLLNQSTMFQAQYNSHHQWISLDIEAGYPRIDSETSELFLPQSVALDTLGGISFNKGCYLGQELIARVQYHKLNKYSLYRLIGNLQHNKNFLSLNIGDYIEIEVNERFWKNTGIILQFCVMQNYTIWIQAILRKTTITNNRYRIQNTQSENKLDLYIIE